MRSGAALAILLAAGLGAGCSIVPALPLPQAPQEPTLAEAGARLAQRTPCCRDWSELAFRARLPAEPQRFRFDDPMPVVEIDGQRSYALGLRLPAADPPYSVLFKAELSGRWLRTSYLFAPTVVLLDADLRTLRVVDVPLCESIGLTDATTGAFGRVDVDDPRARFMVVASSARQLAATTYWEQSPAGLGNDVLTGGSGTLGKPPTMASSGSFQIPHGPAGTLHVGRLTPKYARVLDDAICGKPGQGQGLLKDVRDVIRKQF
ncbi:MAG: hypothetical protein ABFC67_05450 [Mizugakiibacter sp.]|uniref:hypothetical protein n=1 Tax=Mizugakiibacter sp. TaxID=1972610 RepID=UPI0031C042F8|nr:hypothetical protein [Xanthomonadaceae bacterium]